MRETNVEQKIVKITRQKGGLCLKWVSPGETGVPDRICLFPGGKIIMIEVKRPGLKDGRSPRQKKMHSRLKALGCTVWIINDWKEFERRLQDEV